MIGFVVTGHGEFARGITSSLEMIGGKQEQYETVLFLAENPLEQLGKDIRAAIKKVDSGEGVIVFTDLKGGTPFNESVMASLEFDNVQVITGTNLAMLLEGSLARIGATDVKEFADGLVTTGASQVIRFEMPESSDDDDDEM